jgi:hypothetical protein
MTATIRRLLSGDPAAAATMKKTTQKWYEGDIKWLMAGSLAAAGLFIYSFGKVIKRSLDEAADSSEARLARAFPSLLVDSNIRRELWVPRPALEKAVLAHADSKPGFTFLVVVGPRGAGKSTLVQNALADRPGVIVVKLTKVANPQPVDLLVARQLGLTAVPSQTDGLSDLLKELSSAQKLPEGQRLTLVIELDRSTDAMKTDSALAVLKSLASETTACTGILVLSDADAAFQLKWEPRQSFLWVGGMTAAETLDFFNKRGKLLTTAAVAPATAAANKALIMRLFDTATSYPLILEVLENKLPAGATALDPAVVQAVEQRMSNYQNGADDMVKYLILKNLDVPYQAMYRELLAACDAEDARRAALPEKERAALLPVTEVVGIEPAVEITDIAPQIKERPALFYHPDTSTLHFASAAHRLAVKKMVDAADKAAA